MLPTPILAGSVCSSYSALPPPPSKQTDGGSSPSRGAPRPRFDSAQQRYQPGWPTRRRQLPWLQRNSPTAWVACMAQGSPAARGRGRLRPLSIEQDVGRMRCCQALPGGEHAGRTKFRAHDQTAAQGLTDCFNEASSQARSAVVARPRHLLAFASGAPSDAGRRDRARSDEPQVARSRMSSHAAFDRRFGAAARRRS
jgi:hypothetical protein